MENLSMCRICLATDVRLCSIASHLRDMYDRISSMTFKGEDWRPQVACYICHARLQNCYRLRTSCLRSEELLTQMNSSVLPRDVLSRNTFRVVSVLHFSLGHVVQDSTERHVKEEAPEVIHDAELDQQNTEDIKIEPQEEQEAQIDDDIQCSHSHLEDSLDVMKREPDDVETDGENMKLVMDDIIIEENEPNSAYQSSLSTYNICPKIVKVVLERMVLNYTLPATGVPALKKLAETDSLLVMESENVNKNLVIDKLITKSNKKIQKHRYNKVTAHENVHKQTYKSNICSIKNCFRATVHLESHTCSKHNLKQQMHTHCGNKQYICDICKKQFSRKYYLKAHLSTHTDEKPFQCDTCNKSFIRKCDLKQHMRTHTGEQPFQCDVCFKSFTKKSHLTQHLNTHTGEKRFQCDMCNKCFKSKCNLRQHVYRCRFKLNLNIKHL